MRQQSDQVKFRRDAPQLERPDARRKAACEFLAVNQPIRLGV
jgi:hypothetical protein